MLLVGALLGLAVLVLLLYGLSGSLWRWSLGLLGGVLLVLWLWEYSGHGLVWVLLILAGMSLLLMGEYNGPERDAWVILVVVIIFGGILVASSESWLGVYIALELQTLSLFIAVALNRSSAHSTEAGLKYFVIGAVSSGLFLLGCGLVYGTTGEINIGGANSVDTNKAGEILITVALLLKLTVVPFHMWAPDVYEGAETGVTAVLAVLPKVAVYYLLIRLGLSGPILLVCGVVSIVYAAVGALNQTKLKRLLAYSGIGHMGFMVFAVAVGSYESLQAGMVYLGVYTLITLSGFCVLLSLYLERGLIGEISSLSRVYPVLALTWAVALLSTAGIPPLGGFVGKWLVLMSGVGRGDYLACMVIVLGSVVAGYYYMRVVQTMYFPLYPYLVWGRIVNRVERIKCGRSILLGVTIYSLLFIMVSPGWVLQLAHQMVTGCYL